MSWRPALFHIIAALVAMAALSACLPAAVGDTPDSVFARHPSTAPGVDTAPVLELYVKVGQKVALGPTDDGERYIVPITGGHFRGKGLSGEVMPGGADWQVIRADGVKKIVALYSIRTDDGDVIVVDNQGIVHEKGDAVYKRTTPKFHAPQGKHDWLNQSLFVGTITSLREQGAVIIRVYEVN